MSLIYKLIKQFNPLGYNNVLIAFLIPIFLASCASSKRDAEAFRQGKKGAVIFELKVKRGDGEIVDAIVSGKHWHAKDNDHGISLSGAEHILHFHYPYDMPKDLYDKYHYNTYYLDPGVYYFDELSWVDWSSWSWISFSEMYGIKTYGRPGRYKSYMRYGGFKVEPGKITDLGTLFFDSTQEKITIQNTPFKIKDELLKRGYMDLAARFTYDKFYPPLSLVTKNKDGRETVINGML